MSAASLATPSLDELWALAGSVCDPELPPLTLADLGILRNVELAGPGGGAERTVVVTLTPTYSGCPAIEHIEREVRTTLEMAGCGSVRIERALTPAWTTDWITDEGRRKLADAGIAPPAPGAAAGDGPVPVTLGRRADRPVPCPRCGATATVEVSRFGSTACKALYRCESCAEPFDHFKEI